MLPRPVTARLIPSRSSLASCVRAFVARSTVGVALKPNERVNHFPATPACTLTWFLQGECELVPGGMRLPRIVFAGPQTQPTCTYNPGPVHAFMMVVMPDALHAIAGIDAGTHVDMLCDAQTVFDADWRRLLRAVLDAADDADRVRSIEAFLDPLWQACRSEGAAARRYHDWTRALAMRAVSSGVGRSARQAERRVRAWAGLPLRRLRALARAESALLDALEAHSRGRVDWAGIAAHTGFADQPHLSREARRVSGCSPCELLRRIELEEPFWIYRIWQ